MTPKEETRSHETVTQIAVPAEAVWKAITDAEEITRWFAPQARVGAGPDGSMVGGTMWISWGPGMDGSMRIEIWEPGKHLRVADRDAAPPRNGMMVDYFIEAEGGKTTLRLVHSGFGRGADWEGEYEGTRKGWPIFFRMLKHNLEQHPGEVVQQMSITLPVAASPDEQWAKIFSKQLDGLQAGDHYSISMPGGDHVEGTLESIHGGLLAAVVENWHRAFMTVFCERHEGKGMLTTNLALYGPMIAEAPAVEERWKRALTELFAA